MTPEQLQALLSAAIPHSDISAKGEGSKFEVRVVSDAFLNLRPVARQQMVYAPLTSYIQSGEVHALTIQAYTVEEWRKASLFGA